LFFLGNEVSSSAIFGQKAFAKTIATSSIWSSHNRSTISAKTDWRNGFISFSFPEKQKMREVVSLLAVA